MDKSKKYIPKPMNYSYILTLLSFYYIIYIYTIIL